MSKFIDLSVAIESGLPSDPPMMIPKIMYVDHASGAEIMKSFYPGLTAGDLPGGLGWRWSLWRSRRMLVRTWTRPGIFILLRIKGIRP